jgi:hypothetical protein
MPWEFIIVLIIAIPVVLFPIALIWYLKTSGLLSSLPQRKTKVDKDTPNNEDK